MEGRRPTLQVLETLVYRGPNPYGYGPMIRFRLDLGALEHHPTSELEGFTDRLIERLPGLFEHGCSYERPGGLIRRMREGTWLGHVSEHVALELQTLAGTPVTYGKTRGVRGRPGVYDVIYSYREERVGMLAGWLALRLVDSLLPPELRGVGGLEHLVPRRTPPLADPAAPCDLPAELEALTELAGELALGPSTRALVDAAERRGIPALRLDDHSFVQLGYGRHQRRIRAAVTSRTSHLAVETASDKALTRRLLRDAGLPVPRSACVRSADEAVEAAREIGFPVVVKPLDANHGRGVCLDLATPEAVRWGFEQAARHSDGVMVEQLLHGHDYRILVVDGRMVAAARRVPAHVVGDGRRTVAELVEAVNRDPRRGIGHEKALTRIVVDAHVERLLAASGRTLASVPAPGETVFLRATANLSTGGTAHDVTDEVHPANADLAVRAALAVGLDVAGVDVVAPDLREPLRESRGGIVEVNAGPGFRMHLQPSEGAPRDVAEPVIDMLFPQGTPSRIPVLAVTGTNGKTTTARMVAHVLQVHGLRVGLTTSSGIYIGGRLQEEGDTTGPRSARTVLRDPTIDVAVLETARGGILREGLGFDRCDVGAVLNIQADHLGLRGVDTLEDMAWVKSLLVEVVDEGGTSVLNADDPLVVGMRERARGRIAFFSMEGDPTEGDAPERGEGCPEHLREHVAGGGLAVVRSSGARGDMITVHDGGRGTPLLWAHEIPATIGGEAAVNVQNALAATAIAYAAGVPLDTIRAALRTFGGSFEQNPGRLNVFDGHPFRVILDYGHNAAGLEPMARLVRRLKGRGRAIGVVSIAGDRRDEDVLALGRLAAGIFDEVIAREDDEDPRGRERGEIARLLRRGALEGGLPAEAVRVVLPEMEALEAGLRRARAGDLVVHFATRIEEAWRRIRDFRPDSPPSRSTFAEGDASGVGSA